MRLWIPAGALAVALAAAAVVVAAPAPSDERLKQNIAPLVYGLDAVLELEPVSFQWDPGTVAFALEGPQFGLIAQQVVGVIPELVRNDAGFAYVKYDQLTAVLVNAVQDQQDLLVEQQEQITALTERLTALEQQVAEQAAAAAAPPPEVVEQTARIDRLTVRLQELEARLETAPPAAQASP